MTTVRRVLAATFALIPLSLSCVPVAAQTPPTIPPNVTPGQLRDIFRGSGGFRNSVDQAVNDMLRQQRGQPWETRGAFGEYIEGPIIWQSEYGPINVPDEAQTLSPDGNLGGASQQSRPGQQPRQPNRPGGGGGGAGGSSNFVAGGAGGGGGGPSDAEIQRLLDQLRRIDQSMSEVSNNGFQSSSFTSLAFEPIYSSEPVNVTYGPSSAGASGYDAVPWLSRWGNGASSAGTSLSSAPGGVFQVLDPRTASGLYQQVTWLQTQGRWADAEALLQASAPAQFGGTVGADANAAFYLAIISAFIGGDAERLIAIYFDAGVLATLASQTGLSVDEIRRQLVDLRDFDAYRGGFIRTAAGELIGIGGAGLVRAQRIWRTSADLDLHLLPPGGAAEVFFGRTSVTFNGGGALAQLDQDNLGGQIDAPPNLRVENITVTGTNIPAGAYVFSVVNFSANGNPATPFTLTVTGNGGQTTSQTTGTLTTSGQTSAPVVVNSAGGQFP